jgi:ferric-dicitrate binding protein FerR (iron transport regulator)
MSRQQHTGTGGADKHLTDEQLMAYLEGRMTPQEQRAIEEWLSEEGPEADAIEGLQQIRPEETKRSVDELNQLLHKQLLRATPKRRKVFSEDHWAWVAIIVILLLIIVGYVVIRIADK